ncbi:MAG TPA: response regulator [Thermoanaerobaculia bacterium]
MERRILVVDDEPYLREILIQRLRNRAYAVEGATDGEDALIKIGARHFDLVILDLLMPKSGGVEVLHTLESVPSSPRVIVLSGLAELWHRHHEDSPVVAAFQKPVDFDRLVRAIESAFR